MSSWKIIISLTMSGFSFSQEDKYSAEEKQYMLNLSRQTLYWYLKWKRIPQVSPEELTENLKENRPCFVTLTKRGYGLWGCIGMFEFNSPLYANIISRTIAVATQDFRFPRPVRPEELKDILIEISILTEPQELNFNSPQDLLEKLRPGIDGVILYTPYGSSTYLPQVWEQLPDKALFLSSLCQKHGAPADYWEKSYKNIRIEVYRAIHFQEEEYGRKVVGPYGAVVGKGGAKLLGKVSLKERAKEVFLEEGAELIPASIVTEDSHTIEKVR